MMHCISLFYQEKMCVYCAFISKHTQYERQTVEKKKDE